MSDAYGLWWFRRIEATLNLALEAERAVVLLAIEEIQHDPYNPRGLVPRRARGRAAADEKEERFILRLDGGWVLTYSVTDRAPPLGLRMIKLQSLLRVASWRPDD